MNSRAFTNSRKIFNKGLSEDFESLKFLFEQTQTRWKNFATPVFYSFVAAGFEGISLALMAPLGKGILEKDFSFLAESSYTAWFFVNFEGSPNRFYAWFFAGFVLVIFAAVVLKNIFDYFSRLLMESETRTFERKLKQTLFDRYLLFGKQYFDRNNADYLRSVPHAFAPSIASGVTNIASLISALAMLTVYAAVMIFFSWPMALMCLCLYPVYHRSLDWLVGKIRKSSAEEALASTKLNINLGGILSSIPLVKAYSAEEQEKKKYQKLNARLAEIQLSIFKKQFLITPVQETITLLFTLILVGAVALMPNANQAGVVSLFVFFVILRRSSGQLAVLTRFQFQLAKMSAPLQHVKKVFFNEDKHIIPEGRRELKTLARSIAFRKLSFSYFPDVPVLKEVSFQVPKNQTLALVGETGAGKSTLIHLLMRYYDSPPGSIEVDGVDIRDFTLKSLRACLALVSQDCILIDGTLKENVLYGLERKVDEAELESVFIKARLQEFLCRHPEKWNTLIGERGVRLSGGEKQRLSIARALLKNSEILILDEATSSLDSKTEELVQAAICDAVKDRTAIVIAHRLATIRNADKIVVLERGCVVEEGTIENLLAKKGLFYSFWEKQKFI